MSNCPFCSQEVQSRYFVSSSNFIAIYNNAPILPGHSLVIPKRHVQSILDLSDSELIEFTMLCRRATTVLLKLFSADSFNWTIQEREAAGQTVPHLHLHIILRFKGDLPSPGDWYPLLKRQEGEEHIDSTSRVKLSDEAIAVITGKLKQVADKG